MASPEIEIKTGSKAKIRDPGMVLLFFFLTLGFLVYPQVWYYRINRELRDYGEARGDDELAGSNPVLSVLAVTLGALIIIPPFVSYYRTTQRIKKAQGLAGIEDKLNGWILVACYVGMIILTIPGLAIPYFVQENLNKIWKTVPDGGVADAAMMSSADQALAADPALASAPPPDPSQRQS
jgi:uncharacterized protein DUF4234